MSERKVKARLYKEPVVRHATTPEEARDLLAWLAKTSQESTPAANLARARQSARGVLEGASANEEAQRLARELLDAVDLVESMMARSYDPSIVVQAMSVGWKWRAMIDSFYFAKPVDDVRRREGARAAGQISNEVRAKISQWWRDNRSAYRSDNAARNACARALGGKPRTVRSVIESDHRC